MKPGYKTTEFWFSLVAAVLSAVYPLLTNMPDVAKAVGLVMSVLAAIGYSSSRGNAKSGQ